MNQATHPARLSLIVELPLAVVSRLAYKLVRLVVGMRLLLRALHANPAEFLPWRILSRDLLEKRGYLEQIVIGPRWNTAAVNTACGPFRVERRIELDRQALSHSAELWSLMVYEVAPIYAGPAVKLARHVNTWTAPGDGARLVLDLPPGRYWISVRYYRWSGDLPLPRVWVDGVETTASATAPARVNDFYASLQRKTNGFLILLQYHAYLLVKWRHRVPQRLVERVLLPVGDPETDFRYGTLRTGEALALRIPAAALQDHYVFYTAYNRASLPIAWLEIETPELQAPRATEPCIYLLRIVRRRPPGEIAENRAAVELSIVPAAD